MVTSWTNISKPVGTAYTNIPKALGTTSVVGIGGGDPIGLLLALTYSRVQIVTTGIWNDISKASGTAWTDIPKAT